MTPACQSAISIGIALIALICGCAESEFAPVEGQVFYKGKPLIRGSVMFQPPNGPPASGPIGSEGKFILSTQGQDAGARIGLNKVRISSRAKATGSDSEIGLGPPLIPERYEYFESSNLTADVRPKGNEPFVFHLED